MRVCELIDILGGMPQEMIVKIEVVDGLTKDVIHVVVEPARKKSPSKPAQPATVVIS